MYGLIGVLRSRGLTPEGLDENLLLRFAEVVGLEAGAILRLVLARWNSWEQYRVSLADALRAVRADPSLLIGLPPVFGNRVLLLAAGVCRFLGADGHPFALSGRVLAEVLGLPGGQQDGSAVVGALLTLKLIRRVKEGNYATKQAAEYVWVSAEMPVEPEPELARPPAHSSRPGHLHEQTPEFCMRSQLGGFLRPEHYLAEKVVARKLAREGRDLFDGFWAKPVIGPEYGRQVKVARALLKSFSLEAICRALRSKDGMKAYTLAPPFVRELVRAEQRRLDRQVAAAEIKAQAEPSPVPDPVLLPSGPRPAFVRPNTLSKLSEL